MDKNTKKKIMITAIIVIILILIITMFLLFNKKTYTVTFDTNGGSSVASQQIKEGDLLQEPEEPTKEGYDFIGWFLGDEEFDFQSKVEDNMTLTAHWAESVPTSTVPEEISVSDSTAVLKVGETKTISVTFTPEDVTEKDLTWESSDTNVATVENGVITAIGEGTATITVTTANGLTASCTITVESEEPETPAETEKPSTPQQPETPVEPEKPSTPQQPQTPVEPEKPAEPEEPETPTEPETPEEPETPTEPEEPEQPAKKEYKVVVQNTDSDPNGLTSQRKVSVTENGKTISATAVCDANKKVITDASTKWKIDTSEYGAIAYVLVNGNYYSITK